MCGKLDVFTNIILVTVRIGNFDYNLCKFQNESFEGK